MRSSVSMRPVLATLAALFVALPLLAAPRRRAVMSGTNGMSKVERVIEVVFENTNFPDAIAQPFLAEIASRGALLTNYYAVTHPSHPNYIAMVSGSTHGVTASDPITLDVRHLGDLLEARGFTWKVYAEGYPGGCFLDAVTGRYVRRHVPFLDFANVTNDFARCTRSIVPATAFDADVATHNLPKYALYIPDLDNDGHDTGVAFADAWLRARFGALFNNPELTRDTLFIITFDEGTTTGPNLVYTAFYGAGIATGTTNATFYDHYSLLRTLEEILHVETLHLNDEVAAPIAGIWTR
jgi:hypothetical protein